MNLLSVVNNQFESIYAKEEIQSTTVTPDDINKITDIAGIPLPEMLKNILEDGVIYGLEIRGTSIIINFCYIIDIINIDDNYPYFKRMLKRELSSLQIYAIMYIIMAGVETGWGYILLAQVMETFLRRQQNFLTPLKIFLWKVRVLMF